MRVGYQYVRKATLKLGINNLQKPFQAEFESNCDYPLWWIFQPFSTSVNVVALSDRCQIAIYRKLEVYLPTVFAFENGFDNITVGNEYEDFLFPGVQEFGNESFLLNNPVIRKFNILEAFIKLIFDNVEQGRNLANARSQPLGLGATYPIKIKALFDADPAINKDNA